ncbi:MAG: hypothetical protein JO251_09100 [Verrucomicrobia bacterium]|nr:hypothetical protein [Verrucomicrobiota bacterium]
MASDFDQTLSFNDSGRVLSEIMGISGFDEKVAGLAKTNLVQQGYIDRVSAGYGKIAVLQELETTGLPRKSRMMNTLTT